jgi:hypothetical protein
MPKNETTTAAPAFESYTIPSPTHVRNRVAAGGDALSLDELRAAASAVGADITGLRSKAELQAAIAATGRATPAAARPTATT